MEHTGSFAITFKRHNVKQYAAYGRIKSSYVSGLFAILQIIIGVLKERSL